MFLDNGVRFIRTTLARKMHALCSHFHSKFRELLNADDFGLFGIYVKGYDHKKSKLDSKHRIKHFLSNGEIFSLQTSFCTEWEQTSCCSPSADFICIWNSSLKIKRHGNFFQHVKCHVLKVFVFLHQRWYGPCSQIILVRNLHWGTYQPSIITCRHLCGELE